MQTAKNHNGDILEGHKIKKSELQTNYYGASAESKSPQWNESDVLARTKTRPNRPETGTCGNCFDWQKSDAAEERSRSSRILIAVYSSDKLTVCKMIDLRGTHGFCLEM